MSDPNIDVINRLVNEFQNDGNLDVVEEIYSPDYQFHGGPTSGEALSVYERIKNNNVRVRTAMPDFHIAIDDIFTSGDKVALRNTWSGTHSGDFAGVPATGKHVSVTSNIIYRISDGKIAEAWAQNNLLSFLQQVGAAPTYSYQ